MQEVLEGLGLSRNESKAYLALLELGFTPAGKIARRAKLDRANIYDSLEKLKQKGLVSYVLNNDTRYYEAAKPKCLRRLLEDKRQRLENIMPQLNLANEMAENKNETHIYEGLKSFTNILGGFLEYEEPILVFGIPQVAPEMMRFFIPHFHKVRIPKKIVMKHIYNYNAQERIKYLNTLEYTEARYLPKEFDSPVSTNICGDEVVFVLWEKNPITIQIKNRKIADVYKKYYEVLWDTAK